MKYLNTLLIAVTLVISQISIVLSQELYNEKLRPQFHFSPEKNWQNDPNGLVYYDGEYHLFYQHNPKGKEWGYMHWGHAVSTNLVNWENLPIAIYPDNNSQDKDSCTAYSGSAIVDEQNLLGKQIGEYKTLVIFYTSQKCGQRMAYSTDKGRTWHKWEANPIIAFDKTDDARDPKVFWHPETNKWIMALYRKSSEDEKSKGVSIYTSENLTDWQWKSHINGFYECPDLVKLQVTNRPNEFKWILFDGDGSYLIGAFDGETFTPESAKIKSDFGPNYYATQTWSNIPKSDGRTIQIAWMRGGEYPDMPFNGQMSFPCELSLTHFSFGYKLVRKPIKEIELLHGKVNDWKNKLLIPGLNNNLVKGVSGDCLHIIGEFDLKNTDNFGFINRHSKKVDGNEITYNVKRGTLSVFNTTIPLPAIDNKISLEILIDRSSIEIFANGGQAVISSCFIPAEKAYDIVLFTIGGELFVEKLEVYKMNSMWEKKKEKK